MKTFKKKYATLLPVTTITAGILFAAQANAAPIIWSGLGDGSTTTANWQNSANWGGSAGAPISTGQAAQFDNTGTYNSTTAATVDANGSFSIASIAFGTSTTGTTTPAPISLNNSQSGTITLTGATALTVAAGQTKKVTINSNLQLAPAAGTTTFQITGATTIGGPISDNSAASGTPVNFIKSGSGELTLNAANFYTGQTSIFQNNVAVNGPATLGTSTLPVLVGNVTGTGNAGLFSTGANTLPNNVIVQSGSSGTALLGSDGTGTNLAGLWTGSVSLNKDTTLENANPNNRLITFAGGIGDGATNFISSNVKVTGPGRVVISGNNASYSGNTTIVSGTLELDSALTSNSAPVTVQSNAVLTGTGNISRPVTVNSGATIYGGTGSATGTTLTRAPGTLSITGGNSLSLQDGATLGFVLPPSSAGSAAGVFANNLSVDASDTSRNIQVNIFSSGNSPDTGTYVLAQWDTSGPTSVTGWSFSSASAYTGSLAFDDLGNGAGEIVVSNLTPVSAPEPAAISLLGIGGGYLLLRRRRIG